MPNLVGTGLNQVPTNGMLGGMAYQDPDRVNIKRLHADKISQISTDFADNATDIFIYDTSMDSDGGAWRKRTQHTSWYNEKLGTKDRGNRKEFPSVAVIVATVDDVIIYDGDDPNLPMWMIFESGHSGNAWENYYLGRGTGFSFHPDVTGVAMLNATLVVVKDGSDVGNYTEAYTEIDFLSDDCRHRDSSSASIMNRNIENRNGTAGGYHAHSDLGALADFDMQSVEMTVLPNEPIDPVTGLPAPVAVVSTGGGSSVVHPTYVNDFNDSLGSTRPVTSTVIRGNDIVHYNVNNGTIQQFFDVISRTSGNDGTNKVRYDYTAGGGHATSENYSPVLRNSGNGPYKLVTRNSKSIVAAAQPGMSLFVDGEQRTFTANNNSITSSMVAYITSSYNTGMQHGRIAASLMTDATKGTDGVNYALTAQAGGSSRVSSIDYDSGDTSWSMTDDTGSANGYVNINLRGLTIGQTYQVSIRFGSNSSLDSGYEHRIQHKNGLTGENSTNFTHWNKTNNSPETLVGIFVAQSTDDDDLIIYVSDITISFTSFSITETDTVDGVERIPNPTFAESHTGFWDVANSANTSYDATNDRVTVTSTTNYSGIKLKTAYLPTLIQGKKYIMTIDVHSVSNPFRFGVVSGGTFDGVNSTGKHSLTFTAGANITEIFIQKGTGNNSTFVLNSVSLREADEDRSVRANGLQVIGKITREPVAPGAELLAYTGFSTSGETNYLRQSPTTDLNFGTSDFSVTWWQYAYADIPSTSPYVYDRAGNNGNRHAVILYSANGGRISMYTNDGATTEFYFDNINQYKNQWTCYTITRKHTGDMRLYINGREQLYTTGTVRNLDNSSAELFIGVRHSVANAQSFPIKLALLRFSKSIPTEKQVEEMYALEEPLFRENAKCTLYGTSNNVTALAYDKKTDLLHVGTSAGRSDFQGLRRINNTTTAVTTAISAHDGLIVEQ